MEKLSSMVEKITFSDVEKDFSILKIKCKGYANLVTIAGNMACVSVESFNYHR